MKKTYDKFVFDMDGTLIDDNLAIKDGVVDLFYDIMTKVENPKILICTGNGLREVINFLTKLNPELENKFKFEQNENLINEYKSKIDIACFGGAYVIRNCGKGEIVWNKKISKSQYEKVIKILNANGEKFFMALQTMDGIFYLKPKMIAEKVIINVLKLVKSFIGYKNVNICGLNKNEYIQKIENGEVYSLNVLMKDFKDKGKLEKQMQEAISGIDCSVNTSIQIRNGDKLVAIKNAFGISNGDGLVYIGDGLNDIKAMKFANLSLALGENVKVLKSSNLALESIEDASKVIFTDVDYKNISLKVIERAMEKEKGKRVKKSKESNLTS